MQFSKIVTDNRAFFLLKTGKQETADVFKKVIQKNAPGFTSEIKC